MELVYLWVEKYKNIEKQGFNFSPQFECKYENNELTICDKKEKECKDNNYTENFFDEKGYINITAIVGENGSGKSTFLEFLSFVLEINPPVPSIDEKRYKYFLICSERNNNLVIYKNFDKEINDTNEKIKEHDKEINKSIIQDYKNLFLLNIDNNKINYIPIDNIDNSISMINNSRKHSQVKFMNDSKSFFLPTTVRIIIENSLSKITKEEQKEINKLNDKIEFFLKEKNYEKCLKNIQLIFLIFKDTKYTAPKYPGMLSAIENLEKEKLFYDVKILDIEDEYLTFIRNLSIEENIAVDIELLEESKSFNHLSYGQQQLLKKLHAILNYVTKKKINTHSNPTWNNETEERDENSEDIAIEKYFIFIDEFELGLHPNWQKRVISYMIDFFKLFNFKIDLFITTHSPFLLSDIPKQNIVFLDTYKKDEDINQKEGNCKVIDGTKQTFGANIHTLLSDSFFMDDGLMGEFAKSKINKIIKNLRDEDYSPSEKKKREVYLTIESIGEPFLKQKLSKMYFDKFDTKKQDRIKELKAELKRLENG